LPEPPAANAPPAGGLVASSLERAGGLGRLVVSFVAFGLLLLVVRTYRLENQTFADILLLAWLGFPVQALIAPRYRWGFFAVLSLASVGIAFGFGGGAWLVGLGACLIALCHAPLSVGARIGLLLAAGGVLALMRLDWIPAGTPGSVWPILGSMFMFRLATYVYSLRHRDAKFSLAHAVGYFFMLPNVCFPLFPIVDYKTFARSQVDGDASAVHQMGLRWMLRGIVHLLLYRLVYLHLVLDTSQVQGLGNLVQYMLATYLLYLRVSGHFHLIAGLLQAYGFQLPETHHLYYLASSFTDFWRRINIYWKDAMMKLVYYPSFFRLRRLGNRRALVLATLVVFGVTWVLHSYQWFWLRGEFPITAPDGLFWAILGGLVVHGALRETGAARRPETRERGWRWSRAWSTVLTFTTICIMWSLWSSESVMAWIDLWSAGGNVGSTDLWLVAGLGVAGLAIAGFEWGRRELDQDQGRPGPWSRFARAGAVQLGAAVALLVLGAEWSRPLMPRWMAGALQATQESRLNRRDAELQQLGYYEKLENVNRFNTRLWEVMPDRNINPARRYHHTALLWDLQPDTSLVVRDLPFTVNRWGMRDQAYPSEKPAGGSRVALLGPSDAMGWGVADGEPFEAVAERMLAERVSDSSGTVEILNFGVDGYSLYQQLVLLRERVGGLRPDVVLLVVHFGLESAELSDYLTEISKRQIPLADAALQRVVSGTRLSPTATRAVRFRRFRGQAYSLIRWTLRALHGEITSLGAVPAVLAFSTNGPARAAELERQAVAAAGFPVLDLGEVLLGLGPEEVLSSTDRHPNARGHVVIAERMVAALQSWDPARFGAKLGSDLAVSPPIPTRR
jgi:D-alanyl-lipoteichoic acid acyltransferase DltB (MBOAT superfamily)